MWVMTRAEVHGYHWLAATRFGLAGAREKSEGRSPDERAAFRGIPSLARIFYTPMETATMRRVRARGLQASGPVPVGRVPSRGVGCQICGLVGT